MSNSNYIPNADFEGDSVSHNGVAIPYVGPTLKPTDMLEKQLITLELSVAKMVLDGLNNELLDVIRKNPRAKSYLSDSLGIANESKRTSVIRTIYHIPSVGLFHFGVRLRKINRHTSPLPKLKRNNIKLYSKYVPAGGGLILRAMRFPDGWEVRFTKAIGSNSKDGKPTAPKGVVNFVDLT